jgi:hypothetical protein
MKLRKPPQTDDERRAYQRGFNHGATRRGELALKLLDIGKRWRALATDSFADRRCVNCHLWQRGGLQTRWGICSQSWETASGAGYAFTQEDHKGQPIHIATYAEFACINFLPKMEG